MKHAEDLIKKNYQML